MTPDPTARLFAAASSRALRPSSDFDLNADAPARAGQSLCQAAVLVAVCPGGPASVLLTRRSARLSQHPGQIAFPGGKCDPGDADATATALREASEEVGLCADQVEVKATLPAHETVTGFSVTPVLARITTPLSPTARPEEVAEVFRVPLAHLLDPGQYSVQSRQWRGRWRRYYTVPYGPYYIWGATARILRSLAELVSE